MSPLVHIVDDEPDIRRLLADALEVQGHTVEVFSDGSSFLDRAEQTEPDLVLLDIQLPGIDGWEVSEKLREVYGDEGPPLVAVTAQGGESLASSARDGLGFVSLLRKPFKLDELHEVVDAALEAPD